MTITVYCARKIITMNPANPVGTHIAVRDGMILGAGTLEEVAGWGAYELDNTFSDKVIVPGFIEAHAHVMAGGMMLMPYVGYFERKLPDGSVAPGIRSYDQLIAALGVAEAELSDPDEPLVAVGFDPIYFPDQPRLSRTDLDKISATRPIYIHHASGHLATVNTPMLQSNGVGDDSRIEGLGRDGKLQKRFPDCPVQQFP